jgi:hypothetical protein
MKLFYYRCTLILLFIIPIQLFSQIDPYRYDVFWGMQDSAISYHQGFNMRCWFNTNGLFGIFASSPYDRFGFEYHLDSDTVNTRGAGLWVGGIVHIQNKTLKLVSCTYRKDFLGTYTEFGGDFLGYKSEGDKIWMTNINAKNEPNRRGFDDDADGRIDEDELDGLDNDGDWLQIRDDLNHNGKPDHGEPNVDEDYGAASENDVYIAYRDSFPKPERPWHTPLCVKVFQKSYAWEKRMKDPILPFEFYVINTGWRPIDSVYLGFIVEPVPFHSNTGFFPDVRTAYVYNATGRFGTPKGVVLLGSSKPLKTLRLTYQWTGHGSDVDLGLPDEGKYQIMSSGVIQQDQSPTSKYATSYLISIGPFHPLLPGDTAKLAIALVSGLGLNAGKDNLHDNAAKALALYDRNFYPPNVPPSPPLSINHQNDRVKLDWTWHPSDKTPNPLETWDDGNKYVIALPDTHWRKRNPPAGKTSGGRVFEGFKIWRSDYPVFDERQFSLLKQFDVKDDLGFEGQTGIQFTFNDSMVVRGKHYWYAVTSLGIPDYILTYEKDSLGNVTLIDTVITDPFESPIHENAAQYQVPFQTSSKVGEVKVVPNPYRTDRDYTYAGGGYEGLGRKWDETKRLVWFIHLPPKCTIRIFSLVGEIVKTIDHDDAWRTADGKPIGQEEFYLLSESNRALASGVFVYTVESDLGKQIGKFVVIR